MSLGRLAVLALVAVIAVAGLATAAVVLLGAPDDPVAVERIELRKDDAPAELTAEEEEFDGGPPDGLPSAASHPGDPTSRGAITTAGGLTTAGDAPAGVPAGPAFAPASLDDPTSAGV